MVPRTLVGEIGDAPRKFPEESVANFVAEEKFVGVTVEQESKARIEPRTADKLEISESCFEIERGEHGQGIVELFDARAVVEEEQAVDERSVGAIRADTRIFVSSTTRIRPS